MAGLLSRLWNDDEGVIISVELVLILGIVIFGIIPGLVAVRNSVNAALGTIGNVITAFTPSFTFSGYTITDSAGNFPVAVVQGFQLNRGTILQLTGAQVTPSQTITILQLAPAP